MRLGAASPRAGFLTTEDQLQVAQLVDSVTVCPAYVIAECPALDVLRFSKSTC